MKSNWNMTRSDSKCSPVHKYCLIIINCTIIMNTNSQFSRNVYAISNRIWCNIHLRHTTTEKYYNNGRGGYFRFDYDNNMSYRLRAGNMLTTPPHDTVQAFTCSKAHEQSCMMMIMEGNKMTQTEYLKAIMYSAYEIPHKLYTISGN